MNSNVSKIGLLSVIAYVSAQIVSDIGSLKIATVGGLAIDGGTIIYPLTFTLRDVLHKTMGKQVARMTIISAAVINVLLALYLWVLTLLPSDPDWGLGDEFNIILGPVTRIVVASIIAEVVSEFIDTEIYDRIRRRFKDGAHLWKRVIFSNTPALIVDSALFSLIAFSFSLPWSVVWGIFVTNVIVKGVITIVSTPLIYLTGNVDKE